MHYTEQILREELADYVGVSEGYLSRCFRREMRLAPMVYLNRYRVKQAKVLLADEEKSVAEVALAVGFSDPAYFSRVFQRGVGMSPSVYRRNRGSL
jgi:AraC-like DNA-binding protein